MSTLEDKLNGLDDKLNGLDDKLSKIISILEKDISKNTQKMGEHIDFIENVYENVKYPLGYLCNFIKRRHSSSINYKLYLI